MRYSIAVLLFILSGVHTASAQRSLFSRADREFARMRYKTAIYYYERGLATDSLNSQSAERLALSYKSLRDYKNAEKWFAKAVSANPLKSENYLHYAEALASNNKYEAAEQWYRKFAATGDTRAANFSRSYTDISSFYADSSQWNIRFASVNTTFDEFSPVFFKKGLIFTSNRNFTARSKYISGWDLKPFIDLYFAEDTANITRIDLSLTNGTEDQKENKSIFAVQDNRAVGGFSVKSLNGGGLYSFIARPARAVRMKGELKSKFHDGPVSLPADGSWMMLTRNNFSKGQEHLSRDGVNRLKLYSVKYIKNQWKGIQEFNYNSNEYSTAHPALSADGSVLYFSSDMPGGFGGMDLYYSIKQGEKWGRPVNLGQEVNSKGDEIFPFLDNAGTLYFSSKGLPGLGGMDIFKVTIDKHLPAGKPLNMGYPINSEKDDFGIIFQPQGRSGYFSSNRKGNDDIYSFTYNPVRLTLKGIIAARDQQTPVGGAMVLIRSGTTVDTLITFSDGRFSLKLKENTDYEIQSVKNGSYSAITSINTRGKTRSQDIPLTVMLDVMPERPIARIAVPVTIQDKNNSGIKQYPPELPPGGIKTVITEQSVTAVPGAVQKHIDKPKTTVPSIENTRRTDAGQQEAVSVPKPDAVKQMPLPDNLRAAEQKTGARKPVSEQEISAPFVSVIIKRVAAEMRPAGVAPENVKRQEVKTIPAETSESAFLTCAELRKKFHADNIYYTPDQYYIRKSELPALERLILLMKENPGIQVIAISHADAAATSVYNERLANNRSMIVKRFLMSRGIEGYRIQTNYDKIRPYIPCITADCSEKQLQMNRSTEFYIIYNGINITLDCERTE